MQYKVFANKIGYEVLFVSILFLIFAYYFDHLIILSISLTGLETSIELIVNPNDLLNPIAFDKSETMLSILFGVSLVLAAQTLDQKYIKQHFTFTYLNVAAYLLFLYCLLGIFQSEEKKIYFLILLASAFYFMKYSLKEKSKYFAFISFIYPYTGAAYFIFHSILNVNIRNLMIFSAFTLVGFLLLYVKLKTVFTRNKIF